MFTLSRIHYFFFRSSTVVSVHNDCWLKLNSDPHFFGYLCGIHESHIAQVLRHEVSAGDFCLDVGANIGYFSVLLSRLVGDSGRVVAFEPEGANFRLLTYNSRLEQNRPFNFEATRCAVTSKDEPLALLKSSLSTLHQVSREAVEGAGEMVPGITLDSFLSEEHVRLIKIDVEGHEVDVLKGASRVLGNGQIDQMLVEVTPGLEAEQIQNELQKYSCEILIWSGDEWVFGSVGDIPFRTDVYVKFNHEKI